MSVTATDPRGTARGARRITPSQPAQSTEAVVTGRSVDTEPIVDATFASVCATVLLSLLIMAGILAMGQTRPVPVYGIVGSALFGAVFGSFLMAGLHLAITDSRRHKDNH